jgi:hypothetical protein
VSDQRAAGGANRRTDGRAPRAASGKAADDRSRAGAGCRTLSSWRVARIQAERAQRDARSNCKDFPVHIDPLVRQLNRASEIMFRCERNSMPAGRITVS